MADGDSNGDGDGNSNSNGDSDSYERFLNLFIKLVNLFSILCKFCKIESNWDCEMYARLYAISICVSTS